MHKNSTILGKADIKTDVITENNKAQESVWPEYGNFALCISSSPPQPQKLHQHFYCLNALTVMSWEGHVVNTTEHN